MGTDEVMGGTVELGLEVDDGEGDAEEIDGVAGPGQPAGRGSGGGRGWRAENIPREEETPLREGDGGQDGEQGPRPLCLLSPRHKVLDEVRRHGKRAEGWKRRLLPRLYTIHFLEGRLARPGAGWLTILGVKHGVGGVAAELSLPRCDDLPPNSKSILPSSRHFLLSARYPLSTPGS